jgi:flagellar biosynthesis/type III secretory pathway M-ring protein FliF/YscJ
MAQKKRKKKRSWLRVVLFYLLFPIVVWLGALVIWFFWADLTRLFSRPSEKPKAALKGEAKIDKAGERPAKEPMEPALNRSQEKLADEDRQKLEAILKRLQEQQGAK